jgi:hypothetical protein
MDIPKSIKLIREPASYIDLADRCRLLRNEVDGPTIGPTLLMTSRLVAL